RCALVERGFIGGSPTVRPIAINHSWLSSAARSSRLSNMERKTDFANCANQSRLPPAGSRPITPKFVTKCNPAWGPVWVNLYNTPSEHTESANRPKLSVRANVADRQGWATFMAGALHASDSRAIRLLLRPCACSLYRCQRLLRLTRSQGQRHNGAPGHHL